jgi:hypothetical protein
MNRSTRPSWLSSVTRVLPQPRAPTDLRGGYTRVDGHELGDLTNRATESAGSSSQRNPDDFEFDASAEARDYSSRQYPTEIELKTLRRVADDLPWSAFLIAVVELCERFAYYGLVGPFQNYMANKWHDPNGLPGAIGKGLHIISQGGMMAVHFPCQKVLLIMNNIVSRSGSSWRYSAFESLYVLSCKHADFRCSRC